MEGTYLFISGSPLESASDAAKADLAKRWKPELVPVVERFIAMINEKAPVAADDFHALFDALLAATGMKIGQVMPIYRLFVAGTMQGPGMFDVSALLGHMEVADRLRKGLVIAG